MALTDREIELVPMGRGLLDALISGDLVRARALVSFQLPAGFARDALEHFALRRDQMNATPQAEPWLLRAIVVPDESRMVGYANFHGPPGVNDTGAPGAVSIGYSIFPEYRCRSFATQAAAALLEWARREHGVTHVVCGVLPENAPSIRVLQKLGFRRTRLVIEDEVIFELNPAKGLRVAASTRTRIEDR